MTNQQVSALLAQARPMMIKHHTSIILQCGLSASKQKFLLTLCSGVECKLPRELGACANSVYQALFPPLLNKSLGTSLVLRLIQMMLQLTKWCKTIR